MKHKRIGIIMLLIVVFPVQGGQPTRSHHMRNKSISTANLGEKYHAEIEPSSTNQMPSMTFGLNFAWPAIPYMNVFFAAQQEIAAKPVTQQVIPANVVKCSPKEIGDFLEIQNEIAHEVARRSPEEGKQYLASIYSLTKEYPEWLVFVPQSITREVAEEMKKGIPTQDYNPDNPDSPMRELSASWQPGEIESHILKKRYQLFSEDLSEDLAELSLED